MHNAQLLKNNLTVLQVSFLASVGSPHPAGHMILYLHLRLGGGGGGFVLFFFLRDGVLGW